MQTQDPCKLRKVILNFNPAARIFMKDVPVFTTVDTVMQQPSSFGLL